MTAESARKRVLLLLSPLTYRAAAFLDAAERLDLEVTKGVDMPRSLADYWQQPFGLDFNRPEETVATIAAQATTTPFDAIISVDDSASLLAAQASAALGLPHDPDAPAIIAGDGASLTVSDLPTWLRRARLVSLSLEANGGMCRDLLRARYGNSEPEEIAS